MKRHRAFTLIELLVVIAIIAVLMGILLPADNRHKDPPPVRHGNGTTFSFADGHSEYWKWKDQRTIDYGKLTPGSGPHQPGSPDLHRAQRAVWGKLGYTPTGGS